MSNCDDLHFIHLILYPWFLLHSIHKFRIHYLVNLNVLNFPILDPSPSYVVARGPRAVEAFIQAIKAGKILDKRVKVLVIGQDRVGKTSVVRSLKGEPFRDNETSTDGVKMHEALENPGSRPWKDSTMQKETTAYHYKCAECICKELQSG